MPQEHPCMPTGEPDGRRVDNRASAYPPAAQRGTQGVRQRYVIPLPSGTPLLRDSHRDRGRRADLRAATHQAAHYALTIERAAPPHLTHAHIVCWLIPPDRRRRNPARWRSAATAAVAGLTDAGVLAPGAEVDVAMSQPADVLPGADHPSVHIPGAGQQRTVIAGGRLLLVIHP